MPPIIFHWEGVAKQLRAINPSKATTPDKLPARVIKEAADDIAPVITHLLQQSYDSGTLPDDWTHALVTAAYKKGSKADALNYRPISLTCILCKVSEHIVLSNL